MIKLYQWDVTPLGDEKVYKRYYETLSPARREKTDRYRFPKDRMLSVGAGVLLDHGLADYGFREKTMRYGTGENGKPYFIDAPDIHFNLSHSGTLVVAAFSDGPIGCDAEMIADARLDVARRFFHPLEYEALCSITDPDEQRTRFCRYWTLKESYVKLTGRGLTQPFNTFFLRIESENVTAEGVKCRFGEYGGRAGYRVAWCTSGADASAISLCMDDILK